MWVEKEMATHSSILDWEIPWTEMPGGAIVHGVEKESDTTEQHTLSLSIYGVGGRVIIHSLFFSFLSNSSNRKLSLIVDSMCFKPIFTF